MENRKNNGYFGLNIGGAVINTEIQQIAVCSLKKISAPTQLTLCKQRNK